MSHLSVNPSTFINKAKLLFRRIQYVQTKIRHKRRNVRLNDWIAGMRKKLRLSISFIGSFFIFRFLSFFFLTYCNPTSSNLLSVGKIAMLSFFLLEKRRVTGAIKALVKTKNEPSIPPEFSVREYYKSIDPNSDEWK